MTEWNNDRMSEQRMEEWKNGRKAYDRMNEERMEDWKERRKEGV